MDSKTRTEKITTLLEKAFGTPTWQGHSDVLDNLILTILSQSTNDKNRDTAFARLKTAFPEWEAAMHAPAKDIADAIRPAGLGNQKSVRIKDVLRWVYDTYHTFDLSFVCDMPPQEVIDTFTQLKGVGIKTVSVLLMFTCGVDIFPVDTHVHRICRRLGLVPPNASAEKTHHAMQPLVPEGRSYSLHMNLLHLGRNVCYARKPRCGECPVREVCERVGVEQDY